jgi:hypothetical protein
VLINEAVNKAKGAVMIEGAIFVKAAEEAGYSVRSYSGRAMYGKKCVGIDVEQGINEAQVAADIMVSAAGMDPEDSAGSIVERLIDFQSAFSAMRSDSMGLGIIIYFPRMEWEDSFNSDREEEEEEEELD